jgi:menaquinol-cytochrome c reductase cytochrome b/c subunit
MNDCRVYVDLGRCSTAGNVLVFGVAEPVVSGPLRVMPPPAVKRVGGAELREFEVGGKVAVDLGCLACHRIGTQGKDGPGPVLTKVGNRLSSEQMMEAIVSPTAPMPSYRNLPKAKLGSLVKFLLLLKLGESG